MKLKDLAFRRDYPAFHYKSYHIQKDDGRITLRFDFEIPGLCTFSPTTVIETGNLSLMNPPDDEAARELVFSLGLVECVSYLKAVCPERLVVHCGALSEEDRRWWQKLYYHGLGEFLYRNDLQTDEQSLLTICAPEKKEASAPAARFGMDVIIPVGGGKDSAVTATLLKNCGKRIRYFTVNDQPARTATVLAAGGSERDMIRTRRTIAPNLLKLNREGFLNGHTPFSAIVAFLAAYCAYLTGSRDIVLSNEASANESNIAGLPVNHQYSKSYEFEQDVSDYIQNRLGLPMRYFSLLRPFNELQIAKYFAALPAFHPVFRSCNAGSKQNIWCGHCPKCLFVYCILAPFLPKDALDRIFGGCLTDKTELLEDFKGLCGLSPVKPFECVGTVSELCAALQMTIQKYQKEGIPLPALLAYYAKETENRPAPHDFLSDYNEENGIPAEYLPYVKEMYRYVSQH